MHNLLSETRISLAKLAQRENVHVITVWRWFSKGVAGVKLEGFSVGQRRFSTEQAFSRWVEAVTAAKNGQYVIPSRTNRKREADKRRAHKRNVAARLIEA